MNRERARGLAPATAIAASLALGLTATGCAATAGATSSSHTALTSAAASAPPQPSAPPSAPTAPSMPSTVSASATFSAASASSAATPRYVLYDCSFQGIVEPATDTLTCADANALLRGLHWATWTPQLASGYGTFVENDCQPNCAEGRFHSYPVVVTAWGSGSVQGHPAERRYTELTLMFPGARPPYYNDSSKPTYPLTQTFPA